MKKTAPRIILFLFLFVVAIGTFSLAMAETKHPLSQKLFNQYLLNLGHIEKFHSKSSRPGTIAGYEVRPKSSIPSVGNEQGLRMHTQLRILVPSSEQDAIPTSGSIALRNTQMLGKNGLSTQDLFGSNPNVNTPASIACVYQLVPQNLSVGGCSPAYTSANPAGGGGAIALVDFYDYPNAASDLNYFSQYFHLPQANFQVVYSGGSSPFISGTQPATGALDYNIEAALDIEWAHAMAPYAKIFLVETPDNSDASLLTGVLAAQYLVSTNGGGEISMSVGANESSLETSDDSVYAAAPSNVVQLAASGDTGSVVVYPAASPYVISVGATSVNRDGNGNFINETPWTSSGGGLSQYETLPSFQNLSQITTVVGTSRGTPDIAMLGDPNTGVSVYVDGNWAIIGGTSLAAPLAAGLLNLAASKTGVYPSFSTQVQNLYSNGIAQTNSRDVTSGSCGSHSATSGYDLCTGTGTLIGYPYDSTKASTNKPSSQSAACQGLASRGALAAGAHISDYCRN